MKKILAMLLSLMLLAGCAAGFAEEAAAPEKQIFGVIRANGEFTLEGILPEGYQLIPFQQDDDAVRAYIRSEDGTRPEIMLSIAYDETYAGVDRLNDLSDEELLLLEKTFTDTEPFANIVYDETAHGTRLMLCRTTGVNYDSLDILSIYRGYFVEAFVTPGKDAPEQVLTDEQIALCNTVLSDLEFVPGTVTEELKLAGRTFDAEITGFDPAVKTVDITLLAPVTLTEWEVISIYEGDTITLGDEAVEITSLRYEGDDAVINEEYYLTRTPSGLYTISDLDYPILKEVLTDTLPVPDTLVYVEGIDAETGTPLDERQTLTAADLFAALAAAQESGIGFDSRNVNVTFDENSKLSQVERFYAPWQ